MKFKEYQEKAARTNAKLGIKLDLSHMVLGMNTEIEEIEDAILKEDKINFQEEIADYMWYYANYLKLRNIDEPKKEIKFKKEIKELIQLLYNKTAKLQDLVKKFIAYNKKIDEEKEINILTQIYNIILAFDINLEKALENNINKLKVRYPDKFDQDRAINRNIKEERKKLI